MKIKALLWIFVFVLLISSVSAVIDWDTDVHVFIPLFNTEGSTDGITDISNQSRDFLATGASFNAGEDGFEFDGTNDYLTFDGTTFLSPGDTFSICMWANADVTSTSANYDRLFDSAEGGSGWWAGLDSTGEHFTLNLNDGSGVFATSTATLTAGTWYHYCGTYDGSLDMTTYTNAGNTGTNTRSSYNQDSDWYMRIGAYTDGSGNPSVNDRWDGEISDFIIFSKELSSTEVTALYNKGRNYNPYATTNISNFTIRLITEYGLDVDFENGTTLSNTTGRIIVTSINRNDTQSLINFTISPAGTTLYFWNISVENWNTTQDYNFTFTEFPFINLTDDWDNSSLTGGGVFYALDSAPASYLYTDDNDYGEGNNGIYYLPVNTTIRVYDYYGFTEYYDPYPTYGLFNLTGQNANDTMYKAISSFSAYEILTGNSLNASISVTDGTITKTRYSGDLFYLTNGTYNITYSLAPYYDVNTLNLAVSYNTTTSYNATMSSTVINLTCEEAITNSSINTFTGWLYHNDTDTNITFSTSTGFYEIPSAVDESFYLVVTTPGTYATARYTVVPNQSVFNYTIYMYDFNSIRFNIYNGTTTNLMGQNVTLDVIGTVFPSFSNVTGDGTIIVSLLDPEDYEIRFYSDGFINQSIFLTVTNDSTQEVNVYMVSATGTDLQRVNVIDESANIVEGAIVRLQKEVIGGSNSFYTVDEKTSNSEGDVGFYVTKSTTQYYRFIVVYEGEVRLVTTKTVFFPGIDEIIQLQIDTSTSETAPSLESYLSVGTSLTWSNTSNQTVTFEWVDADNLITGARLLITYTYLNQTHGTTFTYYDSNLSGFSGSQTVHLPIINDTEFTIKGYIRTATTQKLYETAKKVFDISIVPNKELGLLLAVAVFLFVAMITISLKPLFSLILSFMILVPLTLFKIIFLPATIITSFIALSIILFIKIKRGGE